MTTTTQGNGSSPKGDEASPSTSRSCDVLVVGAGPAGIAAAREVARTGASAILVEASGLPRRKSCGGMLNEHAERFLERELGALPERLVLAPEWVHFRYYDWDRHIKKPCSLRFHNVDRALFDAWLLDAMLDGLPGAVEVWDHARYLDCEQAGDEVIARVRRAGAPTEVRCRYLVGADGALSSVRSTHPSWPQTRHYTTVQEYVRIEPGSIEPWFDCIYTRHVGGSYGYGYIVPKGEVAIVGSVLYPGARDVADAHEKAIEIYRQRYPLLEPVRREGGVAIQVGTIRDVVSGEGRVLMVGEGAGIMSPSSGEGISFALNSGRLAGRAIAEALAGRGDEGAGTDAGVTGTGAPDAASGPGVVPASPALLAYDRALVPIRKSIHHRLRIFPIMNSSWGKWLGGCMPTALISKITERL